MKEPNEHAIAEKCDQIINLLKEIERLGGEGREADKGQDSAEESKQGSAALIPPGQAEADQTYYEELLIEWAEFCEKNSKESKWWQWAYRRECDNAAHIYRRCANLFTQLLPRAGKRKRIHPWSKTHLRP